MLNKRKKQKMIFLLHACFITFFLLEKSVGLVTQKFKLSPDTKGVMDILLLSNKTRGHLECSALCTLDSQCSAFSSRLDYPLYHVPDRILYTETDSSWITGFHMGKMSNLSQILLIIIIRQYYSKNYWSDCGLTSLSHNFPVP